MVSEAFRIKLHFDILEENSFEYIVRPSPPCTSNIKQRFKKIAAFHRWSTCRVLVAVSATVFFRWISMGSMEMSWPVVSAEGNQEGRFVLQGRQRDSLAQHAVETQV